MWLKDEYGTKAFFPNPNNTSFVLTSDVGILITSFEVKGVPTSHVNTSSPGPSADVVTRNSIVPTSYKPVLASKRPASANVKLVRAHLSRAYNGKPEFIKLGQAFVDVTDATANVYYITRVIQKKWGEEYVLMTGD